MDKNEEAEQENNGQYSQNFFLSEINQKKKESHVKLLECVDDNEFCILTCILTKFK